MKDVSRSIDDVSVAIKYFFVGGKMFLMHFHALPSQNNCITFATNYIALNINNTLSISIIFRYGAKLFHFKYRFVYRIKKLFGFGFFF